MAVATWVGLGTHTRDPKEIADSVLASLLPLPTSASDSRLMRKHWDDMFLRDGWVRGLAVGSGRLSIGYSRGQIGLCIQLGNTSRVYADLLKLETLYRCKAMDTAVLVVPSDEYSRSLGTNYAMFSRAELDINDFAPTITVPIVLVSIDNRRRG